MATTFADIDPEKATRQVLATLSLGMEAIALEAWEHAIKKHPFKNRTGQAEASIRIESKRERGRYPYKRFRLAGGGKPGSGAWKSYPRGRPGGPGGGSGTVSGGVSSKISGNRGFKARQASYQGEVYYFLYLELGTKKMRSYPTLRPAIVAQKPKLNRMMRRLNVRFRRAA